MQTPAVARGLRNGYGLLHVPREVVLEPSTVVDAPPKSEDVRQTATITEATYEVSEETEHEKTVKQGYAAYATQDVAEKTAVSSYAST